MIISVTIFMFIGKWITPHVTGRRPAPCSFFTLSSLSGNRMVMYGGSNPDTLSSDVIYLCTIIGYELVSIYKKIVVIKNNKTI